MSTSSRMLLFFASLAALCGLALLLAPRTVEGGGPGGERRSLLETLLGTGERVLWGAALDPQLWQQLEIGMTEAEVRELLGPPTSTVTRRVSAPRRADGSTGPIEETIRIFQSETGEEDDLPPGQRTFFYGKPAGPELVFLSPEQRPEESWWVEFDGSGRVGAFHCPGMTRPAPSEAPPDTEAEPL